MNQVRQLLRNPLLSSALCVLLTVSFAFLTLSTGVFSTAVNTVNELNRRFAVMAYPNSEWSYEVTKYPLKARRFFDNIKEDRNIVEAMHTLSFSNGNARNIRTLLSFEEYKKYNTHCDYPYDYAVFKVKMKKLHKPCEYTDYIFKNIDGEIKYEEQTKYMQKNEAELLEIVKMHPGYTIPTNDIEISFSANEESDLNHKMEEGESYFVYGQYYDIALIHRIMYARIINVPVEKLMDYYASYTDQEIEEMIEIGRKLGIEDDRPVRHIFNPETHGVVMTAQHLKDFHTYRFLVHGYVEISEKDQLKDILKI